MMYKVVPAATVVQGSTTNVANYYENIIKKHEANGWRFCSMGTATAQENPGCALLGLGPKNTQTNLLVFCREEAGTKGTASRASTAASSAQKSVAASSGARPAAPVADQWKCNNCGTMNKAEHGMCKKCGSYRSAK